MKRLSIVILILLSACSKPDTETEKSTGCENPQSLSQFVDDDSYMCLIPQTKRKSLVIYFMSNDCPGCGSWGTKLFHEILDENAGKVNPLQVHIKYSDPWIIAGLSDSLVDRFGPNYTPFNMLENISLTGRIQVNSNFEQVKANAKQEIDERYAQAPEVSPAINFNVHYDRFEIHYGARFEQEVEGDYYLGLYLVEDSLEWNQAGSSVRPYIHDNTIRGFAESPWGPQLISGKANAGKVIVGKASIDREQFWKTDDLYLLGIVWKRNALGKMEVVNSVVYRP